MLDLRHLMVLREIARTGSYSAAGRALGYTQPAISQQVRALERAVGTPLVVRMGRSMRLTEAGTALTRHAVNILGGVAAAEEEVAALAGLRAGRVRLVAFPSGSATLVPAAIARVAARHPALRVALVEAEPPASVDLLRTGDCEVALAFSYDGSHNSSYDGSYDGGQTNSNDQETAGLARVRLLADPLAALVPAGHPLTSHPVVRLAELAGEKWIAGCPRCRGHLVQACADNGFDPDIRFATDDYVAVQSLVAAGLGVALVPGLVLDAFHHEKVAALPLEPSETREIVALTVPELRRVPAVAAMLEALTWAARHGEQPRSERDRT